MKPWIWIVITIAVVLILLMLQRRAAAAREVISGTSANPTPQSTSGPAYVGATHTDWLKKYGSLPATILTDPNGSVSVVQ